MKKFFTDYNDSFQDSIDTVELLNRNGEEVEITSKRLVDENDTLYKKEITNFKLSADGRWLPVTVFTGISWKNYEIPEDRQQICLNPFEHHENRLVYLGIDGGITQKGNVLCSECFEYNMQRKEYAESFRCLWRLIWNPEEF